MNATLRSTLPAGHVCVLNTHLFYHPNASHVRLFHAAAAVHAGMEVAREHGLDPNRCAMLFGGDFNSDLKDGVPGGCGLCVDAWIKAKQTHPIWVCWCLYWAPALKLPRTQLQCLQTAEPHQLWCFPMLSFPTAAIATLRKDTCLASRGR